MRKRLDSILHGLRTVRRVKIEKVVSIFGHPFKSSGGAGVSHLVKTLQQYEENQSLGYKESELYRFHSSFQPASTHEALEVSSASSPLPLFVYPWGAFRRNSEGQKDVQRSRFCGPTSDVLIEQEFVEFLALFRSIRDDGFRSFLREPMIAGTLLQSQDYRFVVLQGNHRVAALSYLGYDTILVRGLPGFHSKIEVSKLHSWECVSNGACSIDDARALFQAFYR